MTNGKTGTGGIMTRTYKSGSIIYFEGDKSEYVYILKSGRVFLTSIKLDTGEEVKEDVRHGEFFGVKSALGKYPREETAQTVGETSVLVLGLADFERLVLRNVNVVRKMLRVFSNQLRRIHKMVRSALGEGEAVNPAVELFRIGEYYYKAGVFEQAAYAFKKYMEYYPDTEYAATAMQRIKAIDSGDVAPSDGDMDFGDVSPSSAPSTPSADDGFSFDDDAGPMDDFTGSETKDSSSLSSEMDDFLASDDNLGDFDDFSFDDSSAGVSSPPSIEKAESHIESGNFDEALQILETLKGSGSMGDENGDARLALNIGKCNVGLGQYKEAMQQLGALIKQYPQSDSIKAAYFQIALVFEAVNQGEKARTYLMKVSSMPPQDNLTEEAREKLKQL